MTLANYINDLLYRYDCVIVPNFGGFITNKISAKINNEHTFYPPTKQIAFNKNLQHNDGLLANYIASSQNISFEKANVFIANQVAKWQEELQQTSIKIAEVGTLQLNTEKHLVFEPNIASNFLTASFGLATVEAKPVPHLKEVKTFIPVNQVAKKEKKSIPNFVKYAASVAVLLALGIAGYNGIQEQKNQEFLAKQQQEVKQKIQQATFVIDTPLPTFNLNIESVSSKPYHIIAGAFQLEENALKKVTELQNKGYDAVILGKNEWGLIQVSFGGYNTDKEAREVLESVRERENFDAWLLVKNNE